MFGLTIFLGAELVPIITSYNKLDPVRDEGGPNSTQIIEYFTLPKWEEEVHPLTNGRGIEVATNNVGRAEQAQDLTSPAR